MALLCGSQLEKTYILLESGNAQVKDRAPCALNSCTTSRVPADESICGCTQRQGGKFTQAATLPLRYPFKSVSVRSGKPRISKCTLYQLTAAASRFGGVRFQLSCVCACLFPSYKMHKGCRRGLSLLWRSHFGYSFLFLTDTSHHINPMDSFKPMVPNFG